jgi:hypothetical protein
MTKRQVTTLRESKRARDTHKLSTPEKAQVILRESKIARDTHRLLTTNRGVSYNTKRKQDSKKHSPPINHKGRAKSEY